MKEGIYTPEQLSNEAYHADLAVGSSGIKDFLECPAIYYANYIKPELGSRKETNNQSIGSHAHISLLEPDLFESRYMVAPKTYISCEGKKNEEEKELNKKSVTGWKDFEKEAAVNGKVPLLWKEYEQVCTMTAAIKRHPIANAMLSGGCAEMSFFAKCPETGIMQKSRPDYLVKINGFGTVLVDYKTTAVSLANSKQSNLAFNLGRQIQAAHHKRVTELATGGKINEVVYVTQMQDAPYLIKIFRMPHEAIAVGDDMIKSVLEQMAVCQEQGEYPDYPHEIEDYVMPRWMDYAFN